MLDIKFVRENPDLVQKAADNKGVKISVAEFLSIDKKRRELLQEVESLRAEQNKKSRDKPSDEDIAVLKDLKEKLQKLEGELDSTEFKFKELLYLIPNIPHEDVPVGKDETDNKIIKIVGKIPKFNFEAKDHLELGEKLGIIDVERASKVSGTRFSYLKKEAALLEFALIRLALDLLIKNKFVPILPPMIIKKDSMQGMGYMEHGGQDDMYVLDKDGLVLIGTSEQSIGPMHSGEVLDVKKPLRYAGFSTCFRREAGSYGKDTRGIMRVHQFDKVEMFSITHPDESDKEHEFLLGLEEKLLQSLKIPYQVVKMCTGDLGAPVARKYDLEAWIPSQNKYREVTSTSTTTDFQSRRLNVKYRDKDKTSYVHMLNGTAFAIGRMIVAIIENYQTQKGTIKIPKALIKHMNGIKEIK